MPVDAGDRPAAAEVRSAVLAAALVEVAEVGVERASLRSVSRRVGISHQAISYHFPGRAALLTAVAVQGWNVLVGRFRVALADSGAGVPGAAVVAIGSAYIAFAREDRARFALMLSTALDQDDEELVAARAAVWRLHRRTVERESARGWGGDVPPRKLAVATYSLAHGLASLEGEIPALVRAGAGEDILLVFNQGIIGS